MAKLNPRDTYGRGKKQIAIRVSAEYQEFYMIMMAPVSTDFKS